jgi:hypothetical protein
MSVNPQRFCAILLISGLVVFMVGAVLWKLDFQSRDLGHVLRSVAAERGRWLWIHAWIAAGVVLSVGGLVAWVDVQRQAGESTLTPVAVAIFALGAVLWLVAIGMRVTVQDSAAAEVLAGAGVPSGYPALHRLAGLLYAAHMLLSYLSVAVLGWGVLNSGVLSARTGWAGIAGGSVGAVGFVLLQGGPFAPPFMAHVYSCALGVLLLRRG